MKNRQWTIQPQSKASTEKTNHNYNAQLTHLPLAR